jgi:hypothetical protein
LQISEPRSSDGFLGVFRVDRGRIAECWLIPFDQAAFDAIWSARTSDRD